MDGPPKSMVFAIDFVSIGKTALLPIHADYWQEANQSVSPKKSPAGNQKQRGDDQWWHISPLLISGRDE